MFRKCSRHVSKQIESQATYCSETKQQESNSNKLLNKPLTMTLLSLLNYNFCKFSFIVFLKNNFISTYLYANNMKYIILCLQGVGLGGNGNEWEWEQWWRKFYIVGESGL